ncbi:MAG TPA: GIY-YIG nuclease family protein [Candidatus Paceibacterota bacterium]|nr:GIY-YIG nuclease family protein [Candidatus Paceibacterota bacterium]
MYAVYIIECADGTLYTGITTDLPRRFAQHQAGTAAKYTRAHGARRIAYQEEAPSRSAALVREAAIKKLPRREKLALIGRFRRGGRAPEQAAHEHATEHAQ